MVRIHIEKIGVESVLDRQFTITHVFRARKDNTEDPVYGTRVGYNYQVDT